MGDIIVNVEAPETPPEEPTPVVIVEPTPESEVLEPPPPTPPEINTIVQEIAALREEIQSNLTLLQTKVDETQAAIAAVQETLEPEEPEELEEFTPVTSATSVAINADDTQKNVPANVAAQDENPVMRLLRRLRIV